MTQPWKLDNIEGIYKDNIRYSVVIPVYNEQESLKILFSEVLNEFVSKPFGYEIIFVNDCSSDNSLAIIQEFRNQFPEGVKIISLQERKGQTFALSQGFKSAKGNIVISLDSDLQNDPADISKLLSKLDEGYDCVCGWRKARQDTLLKAFFSKLGNILQRLFTGLAIHDVSCTLRVYKRECVQRINLEAEGLHRFIPLDLFFKGYKIGEVVSNHRMRKFGCSKYSHKRLLKVIRDFFQIIKNKGKK